MRRYFDELQPSTIGQILFSGAAAILVLMIAASLLGLTATAMALSHIAQPLCAAAVGVLLYLALSERQSSPDPDL